MSELTQQPKSFWSRPEGTTGMIAMALLGLGGLIALQSLLPIVLSVLTLGVATVGKAITLVILCTILAMLLFVVTNKKVHTLVSYMFKASMRAITGVFVEIDPIGIMKVYISDLKERLEEMTNAISKLNGQIQIGKQRLAQMEADKKDALMMAQVAKEKGNNSQLTLQARQAGRLDESSITMKNLVSTMELHMRALMKYREVSQTVIEDLKYEVEVKDYERKMILESHSAMKSARNILNGDPDKKELFDQAMEFVVEDYGMKLGDIENFMLTSQSFVEGLDLRNGVYEAQALEKIKEWETQADSLLLGDDKRLLVESHAAIIPVEQSEESYSKFFNR